MGFSLCWRGGLISSIAVIAGVASADSGANGTWLYPDPSTTPTFNYLDTLNASWTSDFKTPWLHLWCGVINGNSSSPVLGELYNKTAPATGSREFPLNYALEPFSCHFELSRQPAVGLGPPYAMSGTFNVEIKSDVKPITWNQTTGSPSTASTSTSTGTPAESTASPTPSPSPTTGQDSSGSSGLSQGAKAGIGVGVALGVSAVIAAAAAFFWLRRRKHARTAPAGNPRPEVEVQKYDVSKYGRSEMSADEQVHEKDSAPVAMQTIGELEAPRY